MPTNRPTGIPGMLLWVSLFISTAVLSLSAGYIFGQMALSGVTSPVTTGGEQLPSGGSIRDPRTIPLVNEKEVLAKAAQLLVPSPPPTPTPTPFVEPTLSFADPFASPTPTLLASPDPTPTATPTPSPTPTPKPSPTPTPKPTLTPTPKPAQVAANSSTGGVSLQVLSSQRQGDVVVLNIALQNNSNQSLRFLYSFMNVVDDRGRPVAVSAEGLPGDLPPNGQVFQGTIRIAAADLARSRSLSMSLADYPDRQYRMSVSNIPIPN